MQWLLTMSLEKTSNSKDQQIDELKTESFINTAAEAAAKASSESVKKELENFQELQQKTMSCIRKKWGIL